MKKEYIEPEMQVVLLTVHATLLTGSNTMGIFEEETDEVLAPAVNPESMLLHDLLPGMPDMLK